MTDGLKCCRICNKEFPRTLEYFWRDRTMRDGLCSKCKFCGHANYTNYYKNNIEKIKQKQSVYQREHPEKGRIRALRYKANHPDRVKALERKSRANDHERIRIKSAVRKARKRKLPTTFTAAQWDFALAYFNGGCAYCGNPPSLFDFNRVLQQDHYVPITKSGGYTRDNIIPACQSCNLSKGDRDPVKWLVDKFGKRKADVITTRIQAYFSRAKE